METQPNDVPSEETHGWFIPLPGPKPSELPSVRIIYKPLQDHATLPEEVTSVAQVEMQNQSPAQEIRGVGPVAGFVITAIAGGITYDLAKAGVGYVLREPNISFNDRPQVLYSESHRMTFHLQPNGTYRASGTIIF